MACDKCYPITGFRPSNFCGCSNCDKCNRCCPVRKCNSVTLTWSVLVQGYTGNISTCCSPSNLQLNDYKEKNIYNQFFKLIKNFNNNNKNKNIFFQTNPFELKIYQQIKHKKENNKKSLFNFISKAYKFSDQKTKWFYCKKNSDYFDFYFEKNFNFVYWTGSNWIYLKNKNNFILDKIDCKKPFFVVFNKNLEIIKTNNDFFNLKLKKICLNYKDFFVFKNKKNKIKNIKSEFFGIQANIASSICDCPQESFCYSFSTTITRLGDGCGFCYSQAGLDCLVHRLVTVGGGELVTTQYSDDYIAGLTIVNNNLKDGTPVLYGPYTTICGSLCVGEITITAKSGCPVCHLNPTFRYNPEYQKYFLERRKQFKEILNEKTLRKLR